MPLIKRIATLSFMIALVSFVILNIWPEWFLSIYSRGENFIDYATPVVRVVSSALLLMSIGTVWLNAVTGTGNTKVNLAIEVVTLVLYSAYVYFVLERWHMSITWGWGSEWVYWLSLFIMAYAYLRSGKWKNKVI
jgi:MATE family multidrug resistance protein